MTRTNATPSLGLLPFFDRRMLDRDWVESLIRLAEDAGVESIWTVEHVVFAEDYEKLYPYSETGEAPAAPDTVMPDPLEWLSFAAALSERIKLATSVVVASQHSAAVLAKRVATIDALSGGRVRLGVGLGWQKEEYRACGIPYEARGARLDECIEAMRALWEPGFATYRGKYQFFERVHSDTKPAQADGVPILVGGSSPPAARRAGRLGDGWYPYVISADEYGARLEELRSAATEAGRNPDAVELTVWPGSFDFTRSFDLDFVKAYVERGVDRLIISAPESGGNDLESVKRLIGTYQDQILTRL